MTDNHALTAHPSEGGSGGLTTAEVEDRVRDGRTNAVDNQTTRSVGDIIRHNIITRFNILLGSMAVLIIAVGAVRDALFGVIVVANTAVGIVQELRAKRTLDRLALLDATTALVRRDNIESEIDVKAVVQDDLVVVQRGDQIVADGTIVSSDGLEVDEALLTGESDPLVRIPGDAVRSGSVVIAGAGRYRAEQVGSDAYANQLATQARQYKPVNSEIGGGINRILRLVTWIIVPTAALLIISQIRSSASLPAAVAGSVAGVVSMVPEGLVLLTSMAMAISVVRLGKRQVLTRELQAIEGLARVDVICVDKTGTLTEGGMRVDQLVPLANTGHDVLTTVLGAVGGADENPNPSLAAIAASCPDPGWRRESSVPFSSERKWSAVDFGAHGAWVLGAPDVLLDDPELQALADTHQAVGNRVLVLASAPSGISESARPTSLQPAGLVVLSERIKTDAAPTLAYFAEQGVAVKVLSGDHPTTVTAVATAVGLDVGDAIDATQYLDQPDELVERAVQSVVIGRVSPEQKQLIVAGLQSKGHTVAMTGDGVNDLLALKEAQVGIAMGSGSAATRGVAQFVLLDNQFTGLPGVVAEGRRVIGNIERVGKLFLTKTVYAFVLSIAVGVAQLPFPLLPRHLSLIAAVTIGIPAFFLALAPNKERATTGFVDRVVGFALPAGAIAAVATFLAYADILNDGVQLDQSRTAATVALFIVGMAILMIASRPLTNARIALGAAMAGLFLAAVLSRTSRTFYELALPPIFSWVETAAIVAIALLLLPRLIGHPRIDPVTDRLMSGATALERRAQQFVARAEAPD